MIFILQFSVLGGTRTNKQKLISLSLILSGPMNIQNTVILLYVYYANKIIWLSIPRPASAILDIKIQEADALFQLSGTP